MMLTTDQARLLREPNFAIVATLREDGSVHQTVMWVDVDRDTVLLNTASPVKQKHLERDPRIAVLVVSRVDPYDYVAVHGLATLDPDGAVDHANELAEKYTGSRGTFTPDERRRRVIIRVRPLAVAR
jgi:PPOX class probable F420-dependent enzyme